MTAVGPHVLSRMLREHSAALVLYARRWCRTPEDVVQEAFFRLAQQVECPANVLAWLYRVVRNGAISAAQAASRRARHESEAAHRGEPWFQPCEEDRLDAREVTESLNQLPLEQAEVIMARVWGGLSFDEIAELTGVSRTTVFRQYQTGLAKLQQKFGTKCPRTKNGLTT